MRIDLRNGWQVLQDVHDNGENCRLQERTGANTDIGEALSDWEPLKELKQLQLIFDEHPYYGRQLRYFNQAPWWYRKFITVPDTRYGRYILHFSNVDQYCKVWFNGQFVSEHEGYMLAFDLDVTPYIKLGKENLLVVKVWSPWDSEVENDNFGSRTFRIERRMVKGTYEHADGFIQRDVNPIGIYGEVYLEMYDEVRLCDPDIRYDLDLSSKTAIVTAESGIDMVLDGEYTASIVISDLEDGNEILRLEQPLSGDQLMMSGQTLPLDLWSVWDQGKPNLYKASLKVSNGQRVCDEYSIVLGFRTIELVRDREKTQAVLNGRPFYIRGTSYFPDVYISNMTEEKYRRDLLRIREAGFNLIRVHVHVEQPAFYEICTELGIGVMQDSEFNWAHPTERSYEDRFVDIYSKTIRMLKHHTAIFFWVCLNEPGFMTPAGMHCDLMDVSPGPALYENARRIDPSRSVIKGSCWEEDLLSGDSHNYLGSLVAEDTHYSDIYGTVEKFNTEYGFDAPPEADVLATDPRLYKRLEQLIPNIDEIQEYQYKLLKYYTEHYRMQKHSPNNGYIQFLFSDLCLQSFYGIYDHLGNPKKGLKAMEESNKPVGIFLKYFKDLDEIHLVNDLPSALGEVTVAWCVSDENGTILCSGEKTIDVPEDCNITVYRFEESFPNADTCVLSVMQNGKTLCCNEYHDLLKMPPHVKGHPSRLDHEIGCRLYWAE
ncbi:MAG: beta-galactosidase [Oscillospiraceae bacterium]|nr:beta-galactosidase [Oscillospiraceae bacterium]